jgi:hypothetical protein
MKFLSSFTLLAILSFQVGKVQSTCNTSGTNGDQQWARDNIGSICATGNMAGTFGRDLTHYQCWDTPDGNHYDFVIFNHGTATANLDPSTCEYYLLKEIACSRGGDTTYVGNEWGQEWHWRFV